MSALDNLLDLQEQICYVQCGFCTTILLVSVPCNSLSMVVTVRCGHCNSILSVNMVKACLVPLHLISSLNHHQQQMVQPKWEFCSEEIVADNKSENSYHPTICYLSDGEEDDEDSFQINQIIHKPPEKKQRAPSAYNHFIKEEIKRLKIKYPKMTHKQAFSAAAKNWAHCPQSQYKGGGEVDGYGEGDTKMPVYPEDVDNEVHCFGNSTIHEIKKMRQSKTRFY